MINKGGLRQSNGVGVVVMLDGNAKSILYHAEIRNLPVLSEISFEASVFIIGERNGNDVVNIYGENGGVSVGDVAVNTPLRGQLAETKFRDSLMECLVSNLAGLFHTI